MKMGVGVTTYNRPKHLELWKEQISKFSSTNSPGYYFETYIANDGIVSFDKQQTLSRKGIAYRKNECLRVLKDCDYVFLFDDDCFPIKSGWVGFFIEAHKASGQHH